MMRKDVKVGFVVGGILVAVLVAVAIVSGPKQKPHNGADLSAADSAQTDQAATGERPPSPADASAAKSAEGATPQAPSSGDKPSDPFTPSGATGAVAQNDSKTTPGASEPTAEDKWMLALNKGVAPMMTTTPEATQKSLASAADKPTAEQAATSAKAMGDVIEALKNVSTPPTTGPTSPADRGGVSSVTPVRPAVSSSLTSGANASTSAGQRTHVVQQGETIVKIAEAAYGSQNYWPHIVRANPGVTPEKLRPGMTLILPAVSEVRADRPAVVVPTETNAPASLASQPNIDPRSQYVVERGDSLQKISTKLYGSAARWQAIYDANKDKIGPDPAKLKLHAVLKLPEPPTVH